MQGSADDEGAGAGGTGGAEGAVVLAIDGDGDRAVGGLDADGWGDREGLGAAEGEVAAEGHCTRAVPDDHPGAGGGRRDHDGHGRGDGGALMVRATRAVEDDRVTGPDRAVDDQPGDRP